MKNILLKGAIFLSCTLMSQDIIITDGQTVNACGGTFYDTGGSAGTYSSSEDITFTICPDDPGNQIVTLDFTMFNVESSFENFDVYDGPDTNSPLIGSYDGTTLNGQQLQADMNSATGCLTIHFTSDGSVDYDGWEATIGCTYPCQDFSIAPVSVTTGQTGPNGELILCQGEAFDMVVEGVYPNNNVNYNQSDAQTVFNWVYGSGTSTGTTLSTDFTDGGLYNVSVIATDQNGCEADNSLGQLIIVGTTPIFTGSGPVSTDPICLGDTFQIQGTVQSVEFETPMENVLAEETFLPDGSGVSYETAVTFNNFIPGQTITNANDILSICAELEHSYLGDLEIIITCPNGQSAILKEYPGGSGTFLGQPIDDDSNLNPGVGYTYCWNDNATYGTMVIESGSLTTLPAGSYTPYESLSNLVGCPLNGDWTITITDGMGSDNGFIFSWQIDFDPSIIPPPFTFDPGVVSEGWQTDPNIIASSGGNATFMVNTPGIYEFYYEMTDSLGCGFDTTIVIEVLDSPDISVLGGEGCAPLTIDFENNTSGGAANSFQWYLGEGSTDSLDISFQPSYTYTSPGTYDIVVQMNTPEGCNRVELFEDAVLVYDQPHADFEITNDLIEILNPEVFFENQSTGATFYEWTFDSLGQSSDVNTSYTFDVVDCYTVRLVVGNDDGCMDTTQESFCVEDLSTFYVPSAFSPDGDGLNDQFFYTAVGEDNQNIQFTVFNKWGEMVFEANSPKEGWDGRDEYGQDAPHGVYVWIATGESNDPEIPPLKKTGVVMLIR